MGFFDRFRKRIKEVADDTNIDSITAEEDSEEAKAALTKRGEIENQLEKDTEITPPSEEDWEDIEEIDSVVLDKNEEEDWDDLDDDPIPAVCRRGSGNSKTLTKYISQN